MGTLLENPPENMCFACGPANARGLGVRWALDRDDEGEFVEASYTPREDEIGWPGLLHTGLHYALLFDAAYWAALTLTGRLHVPHGPQTFDQTRLPRTGKAFRIVARVTGQGPTTTLAESVTRDGRPAARLVASWRPQSRSAIARSGLELPGYLLDHMDP